MKMDCSFSEGEWLGSEWEDFGPTNILLSSQLGTGISLTFLVKFFL